MILPFRVHPEDIVWNWREKDITKWKTKHGKTHMDWEATVGDPALRLHEQARKEGKDFKERKTVVNEFLRVVMPWACMTKKRENREERNEDEEMDEGEESDGVEEGEKKL